MKTGALTIKGRAIGASGRRRLAAVISLVALLASLNLLHATRAANQLETSGVAEKPSNLASRSSRDVRGNVNQQQSATVYANRLRRGRDGQLYGASRWPMKRAGAAGGRTGFGEIYRIHESGEAIVLHEFTGKDGADPFGDLLEARDGYLYGVASDGAENDRGAVFRIQTDGRGFVVMHEFTDELGGRPVGGLVESQAGDLFGVTAGAPGESGAVYRLTTDGRFTVMHEFNGNDGAIPMATLLDGGDGFLYSVTRMGGPRNRGAVYRLSSDGGRYDVLHSFVGTDGANPESELVQGSDGFLYGVASHGGANDGGVAFRLRQDGSGFALLHEFDRYDLETPDAQLGTRPTMAILAPDGYLYGSTRKGGDYDQGVLFRMHLDGADYETLHSFSGFGEKQLMQDADGRVVVPVRDGERPGLYLNLKGVRELDEARRWIETRASMKTQAFGTVFTVINTNNSGPGSLRQAIIDANNNPGKDEIHFFIFGSGVHRIAPTEDLPAITDPVVIDGLTQPGASNAAWPPVLRIELDGEHISHGAGLWVTAGTCLIRGLVINRFDDGIRISGDTNQVKCNFVGVDPQGLFIRPNAFNGMSVNGQTNIIGGTTPAERNLISANGIYGIHITTGGGNLIFGNYIGTNVYGNASLGNHNIGIAIEHSPDNQIGGTTQGARNVISGNGATGFSIGVGVKITGPLSTGNRLVNNYIGVNAAGDAAVPNTAVGVSIGADQGDNSVGATDNMVGGTTNGSRNVISGNTVAEVSVFNGNQFVGNYIGVDVTGSVGLSSGSGGFNLYGADNRVGGTTPAARNIISGNRDGVSILDSSATGNVIQGNYIGVDATGSVAVGNSENGVLLARGSPRNNLIGGVAAGARNIISGNGRGVSFGTFFESGSDPTENSVLGNFIGLSATGSPLGNSIEGIYIRDYSHNNVIGGTSPGAGNVIAYNGGGGVRILRVPVPGPSEAPPYGNSILRNSIYSNSNLNALGLGIDLNQVGSVGGDGVTSNDLGDQDAGPNHLQNYPVLTQGANGAINCSLNSTPNRSFRIEFFANTVSDPSGYGEGEVFIGSQNVGTDAGGNVSIVFVPPIVPGKNVITATATDLLTGDTSEFSFHAETTTAQPPTLFCPPDVGVGTDIDQCSAAVNLSLYVAASDGSGGNLTPVCTPPSGSTFPKGTTPVSCSATNAAGLTASCSFPLTVYDTQQPSIQCPGNITQSAPANQCVATVNFSAPVAADNCPGVSVACIPPSGSLFQVGGTLVVCVATDLAGLQYSCDFTVTVADSTPPNIQCPANVVVSTALNQCGAVVNYAAPGVTDNCSAPDAPVCSPPSGSAFPKGTSTVTCTVSDTTGNQASCSFTVAVKDTQRPTLSCPQNVSEPTAPGQCSAVVSFATPAASDNCGGPINTVCVPPSGSSFPKGVTSVNCTATDASANQAACPFSVMVNDTESPMVSCPMNIVTTAAPGQNSAAVTYTIVATDNCPGMSVTAIPPSGSVFPVGSTAVTALATDASGNSATCSFVVVVNDGGCPLLIGASATPSELWPPDHRMKLVTINYSVPDGGQSGACALSVTSNEPVNGAGDGDTAPDWEIVDAHHVRLRAERAGTGLGRIYYVTLTCAHDAGYSCAKTVIVRVPHDR
jgi:uncharacterized repeat protein (TIGR03803 family)